VADVGTRQGVVVTDEARIFNAVQQHVGDAEHVRKLLLFNRPQTRLQDDLFLGWGESFPFPVFCPESLLTWKLIHGEICLACCKEAGFVVEYEALAIAGEDNGTCRVVA
jgi:hypothetical protein